MTEYEFWKWLSFTSLASLFTGAVYVGLVTMAIKNRPRFDQTKEMIEEASALRFQGLVDKLDMLNRHVDELRATASITHDAVLLMRGSLSSAGLLKYSEDHKP